jgi:hypothetical protein
MPKCKVGDLCIIIKAKNTPELLGHIVVVIAEYKGEQTLETDTIWEIAYPDGKLIPSTFISLNSGSIYSEMKPSRPYPDGSLMPIRPDPIEGECETLSWVPVGDTAVVE